MAEKSKLSFDDNNEMNDDNIIIIRTITTTITNTPTTATTTIISNTETHDGCVHKRNILGKDLNVCLNIYEYYLNYKRGTTMTTLFRFKTIVC